MTKMKSSFAEYINVGWDYIQYAKWRMESNELKNSHNITFMKNLSQAFETQEAKHLYDWKAGKKYS